MLNVNEHPVIKLIKDRMREGSLPNKRSENDKNKLGLAIEGGGMRGIVSAGMVTAIEYLGCLDAFDVVYGSSAGAINGAYLLSNQAALGTTIYYENINNNNFIDFKRIFSKRSVMSLEFMLDYVAAKEKVLDLDAVRSSNIPLKVIASSLTNLKATVFESFKSNSELVEALRASARIPLVGGEPVSIGNDTFLDALLFESIPYESVKYEKGVRENGCTHILTLCTRPRGVYRNQSSFIEKYIIAPLLRKYNNKLSDIYLSRSIKYDKVIDILINHLENPFNSDFTHFNYPVFLPSGMEPVGRMEKNRSKLVNGAKEGMKAVIQAITSETYSATEVIFPYNFLGRKPHL
jgi:predicted patatin/cPLA2 family phospholipase